MSCPHCRSIVPAAGRRAFTLIELLVVIAIIAMLIGIVMPGLSRARDQAKKVKTQGTMKAISDGLEMFVGENPEECLGQNYPPSNAGDDPTVEGPSSVSGGAPCALGDEEIFGCQWIVRYLMGKNLDGYVAKRNVPKAFQNPDDIDKGWGQRSWYDSNASGEGQFWPSDYPEEPLPRVGPYMNNPPIKSPMNITKTNAPRPDNTKSKFTNWVFMDAFDYPILYYAARSTYAAQPKATLTRVSDHDPTDPNLERGIYCWRDNALFTGALTEATAGVPAYYYNDLIYWDFGSGTPKLSFGPDTWTGDYKLQNKEAYKHPFSFAYKIMNRQAFEQTHAQFGGDDAAAEKATVVPMRRDTFLLLTPGKDGLFGTEDDIMNW